jgi:hypothetical protein
MKPIPGLIRTVLGGTAIASVAGIWMAVAGDNLDSDAVVHLDITAGDKAIAYAVNGSKGNIVEVDAKRAEGCETTLTNCFWVDSLSEEALAVRANAVAIQARQAYADYYHRAGLEPDIRLLQLSDEKLGAENLPALRQYLHTIGNVLGRDQADLEPLGFQHSDAEKQTAYKAALRDARTAGDALKAIDGFERLTRIRASLLTEVKTTESALLSGHEADLIQSQLGHPRREAGLHFD